MNQKTFHGIGVGQNSAWGRAFHLVRPTFPPFTKSTETPQTELQKLRAAVSNVSNQFRGLANSADELSSEILSTLQLMLQDPALVEKAESFVDEGWDAQTSIQKAFKSFAEALVGVPTFEERIADLEDLALRVVARLTNQPWETEIPAEGPLVIIAEDLSPAETVKFNKAVVGVITKGGGPTSHTAIICRQLNIPALVAAQEALTIPNGSGIVVDASLGTAYLSEQQVFFEEVTSTRQRTETLLIEVRGNIGGVEDAKAIANTEASGIGLMRTEFLYLTRKQAPSLSEQTEAYADILRCAPEGDFVFRTFDSASDKPLAFLENHPEEVTSIQLQAIAQAQELTGRVASVMAPMIATQKEASDFVNLARGFGLERVGVMVETKALVSRVQELEGIVDFVSIGTNDLSRDIFKAERENPAFAELLDPWQPELIKAIRDISLQATKAGIPVSVCGEAASDPLLAVVLAGLGVSSVSVAGPAVSPVIDYLSSVTVEEAQMVAQAALSGENRVTSKQRALAALPV